MIAYSDQFSLQARWMSTLAIEGQICGTCRVDVDLTVFTDPHRRLHRQASTDHKDEVGCRSSQERRQVPHGAFAKITFVTPL